MSLQSGTSAAGLWPTLQKAAQRFFHNSIKRRIPPARIVHLSHRNLFIIPNRQGLGFLLVLLIMFVGAVNYEVNLAFALVFTLLSMFVLSIFYTFRNLSGLEISAVPAAPVFAGELAEISVILIRHGKRQHENIKVAYPGSRAQSTDLLDVAEERLSLYVEAEKRGYLNPGRLIIDSVFPFGICRAWSLVDLRLHCLVYPRPVACDLDWILASQHSTGNTTFVKGGDDFHALRDYQLGDSLKHVAWKNLARGQGMLIKEYASTMDQQVCLRWEMFEDMGQEERLSRLCWCVIKLDEAGIDFAMELPGIKIPLGKGPAHYQQMLTALACFGLSDPEAQ